MTGRGLVRVLAAGIVAAGLAAVGSAQSAPAVSGAKAKELAALLERQKLDAFAMRESPISDRFYAVLLVPKVQMLTVRAVYGRPSDIEYRLYHKDYRSAYGDLASGVLAADRFFVEDVLVDGLVASPVKNAPPDSVTVDAVRHLLTGPADPKKRADTRMPADAYSKLFGDADQQYAKLLDALIDGVKKTAGLEAGPVLR